MNRERKKCASKGLPIFGVILIAVCKNAHTQYTHMVALLGSFPSFASLRGGLKVLVFLEATFLTVFFASVSSSIHRDDAFIGYSERSSSSKSSSVTTTTCVDESLMCPSWAANGACDSTTTRAFMTHICCCGAFFFPEHQHQQPARLFTTGGL